MESSQSQDWGSQTLASQTLVSQTYSSQTQSSQTQDSQTQDTQESQTQASGVPDAGLVQAAAAWSPAEVEERQAELVAAAGLVLADARTEHAARLAAIQLVVARLAPLVPVWELEDSVMCPALTAIGMFMEQASDHLVSSGKGLDKEGVVALLELEGQLLGHALALVTLAGQQQGLGVGEVPSLPRLLPSILTTAFACVSQVPAALTEVATQVKHTYNTAKGVLTAFLLVVEGMKVRTVLDEELESLVELCRDLAGLHTTLYTLDFRLLTSVWRTYFRLAGKYKERVCERLDLEAVTELLCGEVAVCLERLLAAAPTTEAAVKEDTKEVTKASVMMKMVTSPEQKLPVGPACPRVLRLLLVVQEVRVPAWLVEIARRRLQTEVVDQARLLLAMAAAPLTHHLLTYQTDQQGEREELQARPLAGVMLVTKLVLVLRGRDAPPGEGAGALVQLAATLLASCPAGLQLARPEGRQVPGRPVTPTDLYTWTYTNLCSALATLAAPQVEEVQSSLLSLLLGGSVVASQLATDLWVFLTRFGSTKLHRSNIALVSGVLQQLDLAVFSLPAMFLCLLLSRLLALLPEVERRKVRDGAPPPPWLAAVVPHLQEAPVPAGLPALSTTASVVHALTWRCQAVVLESSTAGAAPAAVLLADTATDAWSRLAAGGYRGGSSLASSRAVLALARATKAVATRLTGDQVTLGFPPWPNPAIQVRSLLTSLHTLATHATYATSPTLLLASIGVLRVLSTLPLASTIFITSKLGEARRVVEERCAGWQLLSSLHVPRVEVEVGEQEVRRLLEQGHQGEEDVLTKRVIDFLKGQESDAAEKLTSAEKAKIKMDSLSDMETDDSVEVLGVAGRLDEEVEEVPETKRPRVLVEGRREMEVEGRIDRLEEEVRSLSCLLEEQGAPPPAARARLLALGQAVRALAGGAG